MKDISQITDTNDRMRNFDIEAYKKIEVIEKEIEEKIERCNEIKDIDISFAIKMTYLEQLELVRRCKIALL